MSKNKVTAIDIDVAIYRCHVVVFINADVEDVVKYGLDHKMKPSLFTEEWKSSYQECRNEDLTSAFMMSFGEPNRDVLVSLRHKPKTSEDFAILYHEMYHTVDHIAHGVDQEEHLTDRDGLSEARAFLFEYLVTEINRVLLSPLLKK